MSRGTSEWLCPRSSQILVPRQRVAEGAVIQHIQGGPLKGQLVNIQPGAKHTASCPAALPGIPIFKSAVGVTFVNLGLAMEHGLEVQGN